MSNAAAAAALPITDADGRIDNAAAYADGWPVELSLRPLRLHTPQVEQGGPSGGLGGHCFSADFARYLASVRPRLVVGWQMRVGYWWASAYGRQRVARGFIRRFGAGEQGQIAYRTALIIASNFWGNGAYDRLMAETGHSARWIADKGHLALTIARARSTGASVA